MGMLDKYQSHEAKKHYEEGLICAADNDHEHALRKFNRALKETKDSNLKANIFAASANSNAVLGKDNDAIRNYDQALALNPSAHESYFGRGNILVKQSKYLAAIADYNAAIKTGSNLGVNQLVLNTYLCERGVAFYKMQNYNEAIKDLKLAIQFDRNNVNAHYYLSYIYSYQNNHRAEINEINEVFRCTNSNLACDYFARALAYMHNNHFDQAAKDFYHVMELEQNTPTSAISAYYLGTFYEKGQGVGKNLSIANQYFANAYLYFSKPHELNNWEVYTLAKMYEFGQGVLQNPERARQLFLSIAENETNTFLVNKAFDHLDRLKDRVEYIPIIKPQVVLPPVPGNQAASLYYGNGASQNPYGFYNNAAANTHANTNPNAPKLYPIKPRNDDDSDDETDDTLQLINQYKLSGAMK